MTTVGFIGLGSMGLPMAGNLARRGFPVRGFDVSEADRKLITEIGREATEYNWKLMIESDEKLLAEYRANRALTINEVDQDAFRAATAPARQVGAEALRRLRQAPSRRRSGMMQHDVEHSFHTTPRPRRP